MADVPYITTTALQPMECHSLSLPDQSSPLNTATFHLSPPSHLMLLLLHATNTHSYTARCHMLAAGRRVSERPLIDDTSVQLRSIPPFIRQVQHSAALLRLSFSSSDERSQHYSHWLQPLTVEQAHNSHTGTQHLRHSADTAASKVRLRIRLLSSAPLASASPK